MEQTKKSFINTDNLLPNEVYLGEHIGVPLVSWEIILGDLSLAELQQFIKTQPKDAAMILRQIEEASDTLNQSARTLLENLPKQYLKKI